MDCCQGERGGSRWGCWFGVEYARKASGKLAKENRVSVSKNIQSAFLQVHKASTGCGRRGCSVGPAWPRHLRYISLENDSLHVDTFCKANET